MKLPEIQYGAVQPLAQLDVYGPIRVGNARAGAAQAVGNAASDIIQVRQKLDLISAEASMREQMAVLNATISSRKKFAPQELDSLGIQYNSNSEETDGEGNVLLTPREYIPASEVLSQVYETASRQIYENISSKFGAAGKATLKESFSGMYASGVTSAITNQNKAIVQEMVVRTQVDFDQSVSAGDMKSAMDIADTALENGIWDAAEYSKAVIGLPSVIRANQYVMAMSVTNDISVLERLKTEAIFDDQLSPNDRRTTVGDITGRISAAKTAHEEAVKKQKEEFSHQTFTNSAVGIMQAGEPEQWEIIGNKMLGMNTGDARALFNLNRSMLTGPPPKSNQSTLRRLTAQVRSLSLPIEGMTMGQKRQLALDKLNEALGFDPVTNEPIPGVTAQITASDYASLVDAINKSQDFAYDNPEVKVVSDHIWTSLTGGAKTGMGVFMDQIGPNAILASEAEYQMMQAALQEGPLFDPHRWWTNNKDLYTTKQHQNNLTRATSIRLGDGSPIASHIIKDSKGEIDLEKTKSALVDKLLSKALSEKDVARIMNDIYYGNL